jgi:glycosyltransferase involved in cell wall biosynthesis
MGFRACRGDVIVTLDADGSHRPEEIPLLLKPIISGGFDLSIGFSGLIWLGGMELSSRWFKIESEMLVKAIGDGCRFVEVPITVMDALSPSKVNVVVDGLIIFWKTLLSVIFPHRK